MRVNKAIQSIGTESAFAVLAQANALRAEGKDILSLAIGAPDFATPSNIVAAAKRALDDGHHFYTPTKGLEDLRAAIAQDLQTRRGLEVHIENILVSPGAKPIMTYAMQIFGEPGAEILYPDPGFPIYRSMIAFSGARPVPVPMRAAHGLSFDPDELLALITPQTRLIILNSPGNPTGGIVTRAAMDKLAEGLKAWPDVAILSDEIYSRLLYDGAEHVSCLDYPHLRGRTILLDGWSKTYSMTGWRLGYGIWPEQLIDYAERLQVNSASCASAPVQMAGIEALIGPQEGAEAMHAAFQARRDVMVDALTSLPGFTCAVPKGAFYAFPNIEGTGYSADALQQHLLLNAGVATVSGTSFGSHGEGHIRFSYACAPEVIEDAVERIRQVL
ncbi:MAG: pyridoxal phosphate-dependent aminotransferase [Pseudomonadota bacterium]